MLFHLVKDKTNKDIYLGESTPAPAQDDFETDNKTNMSEAERFRLIEKEFDRMSSDEIISLLNIPNQTKIDTDSPMFILPNGIIASVTEVADLNGQNLPDAIHADISYVIFKAIGKKLGIYYNDAEYECKEVEQLYYLTEYKGWARVNCGMTWTEPRFYCALPRKMTSSQYSSLEKWLEWGYDTNKKNVIVMAPNDSNTYSFSQDLPEDIIKKIKRYYSSGKLYENRNEMKENMNTSIKVGDRVKMDYYAKLNNGATGTCKGRIGQLCQIEWDDGSKSKEITTYLTKIDDIEESINNGYRMDNGMIEDDYFTFERDNITYHFFFKPTRRTDKGQYAILAVDYGIRFDKEPHKDEKGHTIIPMSRVHDKPQQLAYFEFNEDTHPEIAYAMTEDDRKEYRDLVVAETKKHINGSINEEFVNELIPGELYHFIHNNKILYGTFKRKTPAWLFFDVEGEEVLAKPWTSVATTTEELEELIGLVNKMERDTKIPSQVPNRFTRVPNQHNKPMGESNELEQRAKKHKKKSKGMGWHMSVNAGDVEKGMEVFNNSTSCDSCGEATAMGEDVQKKQFKYNGPIVGNNSTICPNCEEVVTAKNKKEAARKILRKFPNAVSLDMSQLEEVKDTKEPKKPTIPKPKKTANKYVVKKCGTCNTRLNDAGECPHCDLGDEDMNEGISKLEAVWYLNRLD